MIAIDRSADVAPFEQIKQQVTRARESGEFPAGLRLPPVRRLAEELGIAANTVARAYRELEAVGVIETRGRAGSFITGTAETAQKAALAAAHDFVDRVLSLGLSERDAEQAVHTAISSR